MALLPILHYPDPRLHKVAAPVKQVDDKIRKLIKDMAETMYAAPGIGLAATQVDAHVRLVVIDISETRDQLQVFINPELISAEGEADELVDLVGLGGEHDDRELRGGWVGAEAGGDLGPGQTREHEVQKDQIGNLGADLLERGSTIHGDLSPITGLGEVEGYKFGQVGFVIDDEHEAISI